ncbi:MAG: alcohol dehydrogenase catalytic domain-containing protein [Rubrivivax sp.]
MKGVQLTGHGGLERLVWSEAIPVPQPGPGEVLVQVLAAGVNNTDINTRLGWYAREVTVATDAVPQDGSIRAGGWRGELRFPLIQGGDLCGRVVALGPGVNGLRVGMRVTCPINMPMPLPDAPTRFLSLGSEFDGAFAQFCKLPADQVHDVSASPLSDVEIAAMPCGHGTALNLLSRAGVGAGDKVLVTGASGGVGLAAVQLAAQCGADVTGVAAVGKHPTVRAAGAAAVVDRDDPLPTRSFDAVIDVVAGDAFDRILASIRPGGRYAVAGAIAGPVVAADLRRVYLHDLTLYGCTYTPRPVFERLVAMINAGQLRPFVSMTYPLRDIALAQTAFVEKRYPGKLVLIPPQD